METRNNIEGININKSIIQFYNLQTIDVKAYNSPERLEAIDSSEIVEGNFCPLPEYCLIEDKNKYLAG